MIINLPSQSFTAIVIKRTTELEKAEIEKLRSSNFELQTFKNLTEKE